MTNKKMIAELAPTGTLRVAINYGNPVLAQKDEQGQPKGISAELAKELARELGIELEWVTFDAAGKVFASIDDNCWDIAFLAIDPLRAEKIIFSQPYVTIAGTYLVSSDAPYQQVAELDQDGVTVSVGKGAAYDLFLSRTLQHAHILRGETSVSAIELFADGRSDAAAGVRQPLQEYADQHLGCRVLSDDFTSIQQAVATHRNRQVVAEYLADFVVRKKKEGFVKARLLGNGQSESLASN